MNFSKSLFENSLSLAGSTFQRPSWQNLHSLVQRTARQSAYSADIYASLDGCLVFRPERMEPQKSEYSARKYSAFWYSMDVYLPVLELHDAEIWKPKEERVLAHVWRRIHTVLGWALIPIALAAWTGMLSH